MTEINRKEDTVGRGKWATGRLVHREMKSERYMGSPVGYCLIKTFEFCSELSGVLAHSCESTVT